MNVEAKADNAKLPSELSNLNSLINEKVEAFALGDHNLENAALQATKYIFDLSKHALQIILLSVSHSHY